MFEINVINPKVYIFTLETVTCSTGGCPETGSDSFLSSAVHFMRLHRELLPIAGRTWLGCVLSLELHFIIQQSLELCAKEVFSSVKAEVLEMAVTQKKSWGAAAPCCPGV